MYCTREMWFVGFVLEPAATNEGIHNSILCYRAGQRDFEVLWSQLEFEACDESPTAATTLQTVTTIHSIAPDILRAGAVHEPNNHQLTHLSPTGCNTGATQRMQMSERGERETDSLSGADLYHGDPRKG